MDDIFERNIKLVDYMEAIGGLNAKFDKRSKLDGMYDIKIISYMLYIICYISNIKLLDDGNPNSEEEFDSEDETVAEQNDVNDMSLGGEALRDHRKNSQESQPSQTSSTSSNPHKKNTKSQPSQMSSTSSNPHQKNTKVLRNLQISEGRTFENRRLRELNMIRSRSQLDTPGVGNCFIEALADQTRYFTFYILYFL